MNPKRPERAGIRYLKNLSESRYKIVDECWLLVHEVFKQDLFMTEAWFRIDNPHLGNMSPNEMILRGREKYLLQFIKATVSEGPKE